MEEDAKQQDVDPGSKAVHFSERFRLAKRNVLLWGSATILIATAVDVGGSGAEWTPFVKGIKHSQTMMTVLALIALAFMAVGYLRANREMRLANSQFLYGKTVLDAAEEIENYANGLAAKTKVFANATAQAEALQKRIVPESGEVVEKLVVVAEGLTHEAAALGELEGKRSAIEDQMKQFEKIV